MTKKELSLLVGIMNASLNSSYYPLDKTESVLLEKMLLDTIPGLSIRAVDMGRGNQVRIEYVIKPDVWLQWMMFCDKSSKK